jgi:RHS repeat-associated protein
VSFDAYGDQATAGARSYSYDAVGRLAADTAPAGASYAFSYVGSTGTMASDGASAYAWDPSGSVLAGSGAPGGGTGGALALTDAHGNQVGQFTAAGTSLSGSQAYDPWGDVTGASGSMTGLLGYQSAWTDAASGKDLMGARWYDPGDGDFTSADTVSVSPDPDSAAGNPFAYAADEPLDLVDPTGHYIVPPPNAGTSERIGNGVSSPSNFVADVATARVVEHAVITAPNNAAKAAAAHAALAKVEAEQATAKKAAVAAAQKAARAAAAQRTAEQAAARKAAARRAAEAAARAPAFAPGCSQRMLNYGACPSESGAAGTTAAEVKQSFIGAAWVLTSVFPVGDVIGGIAGIFDAGDAAADATEATEAGRTATSADDPVTQDDPPCPGGSSFTPGTLVLLASGKAVPISSLKPGDKVVASDTRTGKNQPETVTAVLIHHDTNLYNLTVKTSHGTQVIHTTSNHLFWDPRLRQWVAAAKLKKGEHLKTPNGVTAIADGGTMPADHDGWMWDLTVPGNNDHDFYVQTSDGAVLVHNTCNDGKVANPEPQYKPSGARDRSSAVYINVRGDDGVVTTVGSDGPADLHAEDVAQMRVPGGQMSQPFGWRTPPGGDAPEWTPIEVCERCQLRYPQDLFNPGTTSDPGGFWNEVEQVGEDVLGDLGD